MSYIFKWTTVKFHYISKITSEIHSDSTLLGGHQTTEEIMNNIAHLVNTNVYNIYIDSINYSIN